MNDNDWAAWAQEHATMFGLRTPEDFDMIASWRPLLDIYAPAELKAASRELIKNPPSFRDKHVAGLLRALQTRRSQQAKAFASQAEDSDEFRLSCGICKGTGFAYVPHPACMVDGEFVPGPFGSKAQVAVTCSCARGLRKQSTYTGEKCPLTLASYEQQFGTGWGLMMDEWRDEVRKLRGVMSHATSVDTKLGPIVKRLSQHFGTKE